MRSSQKPKWQVAVPPLTLRAALGPVFFPSTSAAKHEEERDTLRSSLGCKVQ